MPVPSLLARWWPVVVSAAVCSILTTVVAVGMFPAGSANLDEVAYLAQGRALVDGHLTLSASEVIPSFRPYLSGVEDGRVVFKYGPVWPALIGATERVLGSTLVLRALLSFAGVLVAAWFALELLRSRRAAVLAAVVFAATPLVWVQSATLLGYFPSLVVLLAASAALVRASTSHTWRAAILAGALVGLSVVHRPFDALVATAPVIVYAVSTTGRTHVPRLLTGAALGGLPFLVLQLAYDAAVMGSPLRLPFDAAGGLDVFGFGWRASFVVEGTGNDLHVDYTPALAVSSTLANLGALPRFLVAGPALLAAAVIAVWQHRRDRRVWLLTGTAVAVVVGYGFWWGTANTVRFHLHDSLGPLYHCPVLVPIVILAAWTLDRYWDSRRTWLAATCAAGLVANVPLTVPALASAHRGGADRAAEVASFAGPAPRVVIAPPGYPGDPYVRWPNDADLRGEVIVARDTEPDRLSLVEHFDDRTVILLRDYHAPYDLFGPTRRTRLVLTAVHGRRLQIDVAPGRAASPGSTAYLRIGDAVEVAPDRSARFVVDAGAVGPATSIEVGLVSRAPVPDPALARSDRLGCRLMSGTSGGSLTLLTPCDWSHHYAFPNATADIPEDLSAHVDVRVRPVDDDPAVPGA